MTDALTLKHVQKSYGSQGHEVQALKGASLHVADNEFFTLLGPSGCGKTTLLRLLAGFESPTSGEILLYGDPIEKLSPQQRPINTVFQHYSLFPHMTVRENILFGLEMLRWPKKEAEARADEMITLVKMEAFANRKPGQMSGGQQQRVALARALAPRPKVLLLDEPLSALDLKLRQAMRLELKQLQQNTGITFVFVTHDQEEALAMSDRIAVLAKGVIQQVGTPREIYDHPANVFVADFIGENNFLDVTVTAKNEGKTLVSTPNVEAFEVTPSSAENTQTGQVTQVALRPETLSFSASNTHVLLARKARIIEDIYLGNALSHVVELPCGKTLTVRDSHALQHHTPRQHGDEVSLYVKASSPMIVKGVKGALQ